MLLAEDVLLLGTDDETGRKLSRYTDLLVAGGLLSDLTLAGNVRLTEQGESARKNRVVRVPDAAWPADPLLADALTTINTKPAWFPAPLVERLGRKLVDTVYERLARAEILSRTPHRALGLIPTTRWVTIDPRRESRLRAALDEVFLFGAEPDTHTAALIALLSGSGLLVPVVDRGRNLDRRSLKRHGKVLLKQYWPAQAMDRAFQTRDGAAAG